MTDQPIADDETAQCWRSDPHQPHMWTWRPEDGGVDCPGITTPVPAEARTALSWAESIASHGTGPTATVDIDVDVPGEEEPQPMEIPLEAARVLHAMLGDLLAEHTPTPDSLRDQYAEAIASCADLDAATDAVLAVRDTELQQLRDRAEKAEAELLDWKKLLQRSRDMTAAHWAAIERVRAECDRIEAAVRANPQAPDFDGAYLAAIGHVRNALAQQQGECRRCHCPAGAPDCTHCNCCDVPDPQEQL